MTEERVIVESQLGVEREQTAVVQLMKD